MVVDPESVDLTLEMNIAQLTLTYDGMKERERERLRRAKSRMGENPRRPWLRRAVGSSGLIGRTR